MSNKVKDIDIKNRTHYFCDDIINTKKFDPNNIKIDENSYKNTLIYYNGYVRIKDSKSVKVNSVNPLYLILSKVNGYFEEINKNKYLALFPPNGSKKIIKNMRNSGVKSDLIRSITKNLDDYDEKYMKIKFDSDDDLPLNKTIEIHNVTIVVRVVFHKNNKYYEYIF